MIYRLLKGGKRIPAAEKTSRTIFSLPVHPYLTDEQIDYILRHFARITRFVG
ncbi:MAG: hypothetical protein U9P10_10035 [Thermodesulfobacteriota bacterium]|nr:hypothetical protein [Thermodesulfobacteriota bacterium]